ncbi:hypothetical protein [Staphylococcus xylosus]|nr:hypothetical protein [Staphylococcus xylosus]MEB7757257.1 hypothetical protein [Staphylococcus xylosus]UBV34909.1 hypothetical protein JGY90_01045 [Staphylococcus xylosus]
MKVQLQFVKLVTHIHEIQSDFFIKNTTLVILDRIEQQDHVQKAYHNT